MNEIKELKKNDFYSILLFILFKLRDEPEYGALSRLAYILDRESLLKLCNFLGGMTVTIPTVEELELLCNGLLLYQKVDIEHNKIDDILDSFETDIFSKKELLSMYIKIRDVVDDYDFNVDG